MLMQKWQLWNNKFEMIVEGTGNIILQLYLKGLKKITKVFSKNRRYLEQIRKS
jgi:hypothetical protein